MWEVVPSEVVIFHCRHGRRCRCLSLHNGAEEVSGVNGTALEGIVGVAVVTAATVTAHWGVISSDAVTGIYTAVLGYVFGRGQTQIERQGNSNGGK